MSPERQPAAHLARWSEATLVRCAQAGEADGFAELVRRRQSWLRNLMRRSCGNGALADDLAQEAFLQAWRQLGQLRTPDSFGPWLRRLALNIWLQHCRRADPLRHASEVGRGAEEAFHAPAATGIAADLDRALMRLSVAERLCILLAYHEGMSHAEIAADTRLPLGTVKSHIARGGARLRELLSDYRMPETDSVKGANDAKA